MDLRGYQPWAEQALHVIAGCKGAGEGRADDWQEKDEKGPARKTVEDFNVEESIKVNRVGMFRMPPVTAAPVQIPHQDNQSHAADGGEASEVVPGGGGWDGTGTNGTE